MKKNKTVKRKKTGVIVRFGIGYDVHRLVSGRKLVLGGVEIESDLGLLGHSDGDVLLHAVCDALLGAAALGDIGNNFPDSDESYRGISSIKILSKTAGILKKNGFKTGNIDSTVVLEKPKIKDYADSMRRIIAETLDVPVGQVSIKATTNEGLGAFGRQEGCAAWAVACIVSIKKA